MTFPCGRRWSRRWRMRGRSPSYRTSSYVCSYHVYLNVVIHRQKECLEDKRTRRYISHRICRYITSILTQCYMPTEKSGRRQVEGISLETRQGREEVKPISSCVGHCHVLVVFFSRSSLHVGHRYILVAVVFWSSSHLSLCCVLLVVMF